jgi:NADH-quinone oxidoreductase subunit L
MPTFILEYPGRLFLLATLLPLLAFAILLLAGTIRRLFNRTAHQSGTLAAYLAVVCLALAACCSVVGLSWFLQDANVLAERQATLQSRWGERITWLKIGGIRNDPRPAIQLDLGYRIDHLTAIMVTMVTIVGTLIFVFSLGYMRDEQNEHIHDHTSHHTSHHTLHHARRGRFGRFYLYLSLFAFAMLNILIADNLFQIFIGWELVGVSSFFLIGFYTERPSASRAANKAFIVNRVGDAGFLVGLAVAWLHVGSLNLDKVFAVFATMPTDAQIVLGFGIVCGCLGKSAQVPLHTWLPDAMEGPTPVSALIHAATMVAAGVYLAARCFPLFTPEICLLLAYNGAITMILSALIAMVQTDIKRILAFSTCSQLGFMMLALGLGAWQAALLHLLTHAFFKALLFLCAGSVIHGLHHEQDLRKMGGLREKMPITAYCMLVGVLAIAGTPLLSGWYSKDQILSHVIGYASANSVARPLLLFLPFATAGLTAYYMTRLWLLAFAGTPRNPHVRPHESPSVMTIPLVILALLSIGVAWGWPLWNAEASWLGHQVHRAQPTSLAKTYENVIRAAEKHHLLAGGLALGLALSGAGVAYLRHRAGTLLNQGGRMATLARNTFYFDALYDWLLTKPMLRAATLSATIDKPPRDATPFDVRTLDGVLTLVSDVCWRAAEVLRLVNTGRLRHYILALGLTLVVGLGILVATIR